MWDELGKVGEYEQNTLYGTLKELTKNERKKKKERMAKSKRQFTYKVYK